MIHLALSLLLTATPAPEPPRNWAIDAFVSLLAVGTPIALCWRWIWEDAPNQPPQLTVIDGGVTEDFVQNDAAIVSVEAPIESPPEEIPFPDIDWEAEPAPPGTPAMMARQIVADLRQQESLQPSQVPGEPDFDLVCQIEFEQRKAWLLDYFEQHKLSYLFKLLQATPIAILGLERCGKNTFAMTVAALRRVFFPMPMIACSPHANDDNPFPVFFQREGYSDASDHRAIAARLRELHRWVSLGDTSPVTILWDESSRYLDRFDPGDRPLLSDFTRFLTTECAKHEKFQIVLASCKTSACLPGSEGVIRDLNQGVTTVFRQVDENAYGRKSPSPLIAIESPSWKGEFRFPKWLNAGWILRVFPEVNQPLPLPSHLVEVTSAPLEVTTALEVPTTVASEVTSGGVEVREVETGSGSKVIYFPTSHFPTSAPTSALPTDRKLLFLAIQPHLGSGKSITWIVQELLKMKGRKFAEGKQLIESLIQEFGEEK